MARQAYTCCDVACEAPLGAPCWSCGQVGYTINLEEVDRFHPLVKAWHLPNQKAADSYL